MNRMKILTPIVLLVLFSFSVAQAQMWNGVDSLYGNEWIDFNKSYYKIMLAEDGIYQISQQELSNAGIPVNDLEGKQLQMIYMGQEIPLYTSTEGALGANDFIEFFGQKNRTELDRYLFNNPDTEMLNPQYSLFTDTSAYFLTWTDAPTLRYNTLDNDLTNLPPKETSFTHQQITDEHVSWIKKITGVNNDVNSSFDMSEGFSQILVDQQEFSLSPELVAPNTDAIDVNLRLTTDQGSHNLKIDINGTNYDNITNSGFVVSDLNYTVPVSGAAPVLQFNLEGQNGDIDRHSVSNVTLTYPRQFDFVNYVKFAFTIDAGDRKYIEVENFSSNNANPILYDLTNQQRLMTIRENNVVKFVLPASSAPRDLFLANTVVGISSVSSIQAVEFIDYSEMDTEFLIISNEQLFDDGQGNNFVQEYADYRSSAAGGSYESDIIEIQQIYDQFAYGINRHSIAVKNLANYAKKNWSDWKYALLLGKSRQYNQSRTEIEVNSEAHRTFYLPTYGAPGSDMLMFSPMDKITPHISFGRLTAETPHEINIYLEKLQTYEDSYKNAPQTIEARAWMSRILHLGGGRTLGEQSSIKTNLNGMGRTLEENKFGAHLTSFFKTTTDAIQTSQSEELTNLINDGVSLITFFGHSSANGFDFSLDNPNNYENIGKYPIISSYGCYAGQIHGSTKSIGEKFILAPQRGAIGFFASVGQGYIGDLDRFGDYFYGQLGGDMYGESVGDIHRNLTNYFENVVGITATGSSSNLHKLLTQTIYQGDPAMRVNPQPGPDYLVDTKSVSIDPSPINIEITDSMKVTCHIVNIGQNNTDSIVVKIVQELPDGSRVNLFNRKVKTLGFNNEYSFTFATQGKESIGQNRLYITADADNDVEELPAPAAENNNEFVNNLGVAGLSFFVFSNDARPLYPSNFGITSDPNVTLKATTTNTFIGQQKYFIQIDTTETFDSPFKASTSIEQEGGLIEWQPNLPFEDDRVYYWRISPDSIADIGFLWQNSSFLYKEDVSSGWNQSHYYQYLEDEYEDIVINDNRRFSFTNQFFSFETRNGFFTNSNVLINNSLAQVVSTGVITTGVYISVIDPLTADLWETEHEAYGNEDNTNNLTYGFAFETNNQDDINEVLTFLEDVVPSGFYVNIITIQRNAFLHYNPELWAINNNEGISLFQYLENQGAELVQSLEGNPLPYAFVYQKDTPSFPPKELIGNMDDDFLSFKFDILGALDRGKITSSNIGPASQWNTLRWNSHESVENTDTEAINIYGISQLNEKILLKENITELEFDLEDIDAQVYPVLQLEYATTDITNKTPAQLDYWRVLYKGVPEATLNKSAHYQFQSDTLQQGETLHFELAVDNISDYDMDSLLVKYTITDANNVEQLVQQRIEPLTSGQRIITDFEYDTKSLLGEQLLSIEVNPDDDQAEQFHINNLGFVEFFVEKDKRNPILDITFDGIHIMNGDLVSPDPLIVINLEDENQYLALSDTALFEVFLVYPNAEMQEISLNDPSVQFFPSDNTSGKNQARLEFSPVFEQEGNYRLLVSGKDATGNHSGSFDYEVDFEVILEDMISNVLNYPNPFSTSTQFVYTLTGHAPEFFKLQIMTIGGRIVKEIDQIEMGELKVGTHQTDYTWDGTDEFGDRLANGIYLYRIIAQDADGQNYDTYNTTADSYFKNGFGKMVILR